MRKNLIFLAFVCLLSLGSSFAQGSKGPKPAAADDKSVAQPPFESSGTNLTLQTSEKYVLNVGDTIEIKVYQEEDLSARARIDKDRTVSLPLLGPIELAGKTVAEARSHIRELLEKDYLRNPEVILAVIDYTAKKFSVLGEVQHPGFFDIPPNSKMNLLEAIATASGFNRNADRTKVRVKRVVNGVEQNFVLNAKKMAESKVELFEVQAGDSISVPEGWF